MACFAVSAVASVGVAVARHIVAHHEKKNAVEVEKAEKFGSDTKWSDKLKYLEFTLAGGSFLLAGEHIMHGEVTPFPPFLTAMNSAEDTMEMLKEVGTVGVGMFVGLVLAWAIGVVIVDSIKYKKRKNAALTSRN